MILHGQHCEMLGTVTDLTVCGIKFTNFLYYSESRAPLLEKRRKSVMNLQHGRFEWVNSVPRKEQHQIYL